MKRILLYTISVFLLSNNAFSQISTQDSLALVNLYNNCNGPSWLKNNNWLSSSPVSTWEGVTVTGNRVSHLRLYNNNMSGSLPSDIGNLTAIVHFAISNNNLTGSLPNSMSNWTSIVKLIADRNNFSGSIPSFIGSLTTLRHLFLSGNNYSGNIPSNLGNLSNLEYLWLDRNQFTGNIPATVMALNNLTIFGVNNNNLSGTFPTGIGSMANIQYLFAHQNQFSGSIPSDIGNANTLQEIWLNDNDFTGSIPTNFTTLGNLEYLGLNDNELNGIIPDFTSSISTLEWVFLENNNLDAIDGINNTPALKHYDMEGNALNFMDLEPISSDLTANVFYANQDSINNNYSAFFFHNGNVTDVAPSNIYQWNRNGNPINGANNSSYFMFWQSGSFNCDIQNPMAPNLTIHRRHIDFTSWFGRPVQLNKNNNPQSIVNVTNNPSSNGRYQLVANKHLDEYIKASDEVVNYYVMDNMGRMIIQKEYNGFNVNQINISDYPRGMYHLVVEANDQILLRKKLIYTF